MIRKILGTIWAFPITLVGLILIPFYGPVKFSFRDLTLFVDVKRMLGPKGIIGANLGSVVFIKHNHGLDEDDLAELIDHELVHRGQCYFFGVFVVLLQLLAITHAACTPGLRYYKDNFMECQAQKIARRR